MGHQQIGSVQEMLEPHQGLLPGLGSAGDGGGNPVDRLCRIGFHRQQKRLLGQHRAAGYVKQNAAHLKALVVLRIQTRGFGIDDQQGRREVLWRIL